MDAAEPEQPLSAVPSNELDALIERKRQDDIARQREFDALRKMRNHATARAGQRGGDGASGMRPAFFQSTMPSRVEDRASTIKKINEIESQMAELWRSTLGSHPDFGHSSVGSASSGVTHDSSLKSEADFRMLEAENPMAMDTVADRISDVPDTQPFVYTGHRRRAALRPDGLLMAVHPAIEEAAIQFANGDDSVAEAVLRAAVETSAAREVQVWLTLCDLYRVTRQPAAFERCAADVARRFNRIPPPWLIPQAASDDSAPSAVWSVHAALDAQAVAGLRRVLARSPQPWVIDWSALASLDAQAARALLELFSSWAEQTVQLRFWSADVLRHRLASRAPAGFPGTEPFWWELRLAALRVMSSRDGFEQVAHEFGVTFKVPAPAWEAPRCDSICLPARSLEASDERMRRSGAVQSLVHKPVGPLSLSGEMRGASQAQRLAALEARMQPQGDVVLSCRDLIRVDYAAAGPLLNWVAGLHAQGRKVRLVDANRLVSVFFGVVGLTAWARVEPHRD